MTLSAIPASRPVMLSTSRNARPATITWCRSTAATGTSPSSARSIAFTPARDAP